MKEKINYYLLDDLMIPTGKIRRIQEVDIPQYRLREDLTVIDMIIGKQPELLVKVKHI